MGGQVSSFVVSNGSTTKVEVDIASTKPEANKKTAAIAIGNARFFETEEYRDSVLSAIIESGDSYQFTLTKDYIKGNIQFTFHTSDKETFKKYLQHKPKMNIIISLEREILFSSDSKNAWICQNGKDHQQHLNKLKSKSEEYRLKTEEIKANFKENRRNVSAYRKKRQREIEFEYHEQKDETKQATKKDMELLNEEYRQYGINLENSDFTKTVQLNTESTTKGGKEKIQRALEIAGTAVKEVF